MSEKTQKIFIYVMAGIMLLSVLGLSLAIFIQPDEQTGLTELVINDIEVGEGGAVEADDTITVHYTGWLASTGQPFESSRGQEPPTFSLGELIPGWQQGLIGMRVGGIRELGIPAELAYGASGSGSVPPNSDLIFEIELLDIVE